MVSRPHRPRSFPGRPSLGARCAEFERVMNEQPRRSVPPNHADQPGSHEEDFEVDAPTDEAEMHDLGATRAIGSDEEPLPGPSADESQPPVLGDYQLIKKLGEGAMGAVYKAHQTSFGRTV